MRTFRIDLPYKRDGWSLLRSGAQLYGKGKKIGDFTFSIEGEIPHPQSLCIRYDDGIED